MWQFSPQASNILLVLEHTAMRRFRKLGFEGLEDRSLLSGFVSISSAAGGEGTANNTHLMFPVQYNGMPVAGGFNVGFQTADTTAIGFTGSQSNADYIAQPVGSLSFSGTPGETKFIDILVLSDALVELTEYFRVELTGVSEPNIMLGGYAGGTIGNDDTAAVNLEMSTVASSAVAVLEDELSYQGQIESWLYSLKLSAFVDVPVDVYYQIMPMGIEQDDTNSPWTEQHKIVNTNGAPPSFQTQVMPDDLVEQDESFQWRITRVEAQGRQVTLGMHGPVNTILNNDLLKVSVDDMKQAETNAGETDFVVTVRAHNKVEGSDATVTFTTSGYTANVGENYFVFKQQAFTFTQTGPQTFTMTVKVKGDTAREANEKFMIVASNPQANFAIGLKTDDTYGFGVITIENDDEGTITDKTGGKIAFYNSMSPHGLGAEFKWCAENEYAVTFDVQSEAALNAALAAYVAANGRVDEIAIFDHGTITGQLVGGDEITGPDTQGWAPYANDGLHIRFLGCEVGKAVSDSESPSGAALCDWVCDDAAPNARVTASKTCTFWTLYADGTASYTGTWIYFDGFEKKNNP